MRPTDRGASVRTISRRGFLTMAASAVSMAAVTGHGTP
ncbi:MAG TPA: twin-arginine translocation signal domain-containing protein [Gemmatimonadales bacterium]|nr:twin-arginine translocation signal domain-containing protein [Gemmatimonadales bacterium]